MATLPTPELPTSTVDIAGVAIPIRSLSRAEVLTLAEMGDAPIEAEAYVIACATGLELDAARAWLGQVGVQPADELLRAIRGLTGLGGRRPSSSGSSAG